MNYLERGKAGDFWQKLKVPTPYQSTFFYGVCLVLGGAVTQIPAYWGSGIALIMVCIFWDNVQKMIQQLDRVKGRNKLFRGVAGVALFILLHVQQQKPAHAFLTRACNVLLGMADQINGGNEIPNLIVATINLVRGLFLIYIGVAAINVVKQARNDEDWKSAMQTPLLSIILIAAIEGISQIVAPDADGECRVGATMTPTPPEPTN